jgi:hypothetical protein
MEDTLNNIQLKFLLNRLYDGNDATIFYLLQLHAFYSKKKDKNREHSILLWLAKNGLTGQKLVDFFGQFEGSFLNGLNYIVSKIDRRNRLININEAL